MDTTTQDTEPACTGTKMRGHDCQLPSWHLGNHQALVTDEETKRDEVWSWPRKAFTVREVRA